jgi:hypothetical protein
MPSINIYHITNLSIAQRILSTGCFEPRLKEDLNLDNGLNCFNTILNYTTCNDYEAEGVKIHFEWSGDISNEKNVLNKEHSVYYEEHPHRGFIKAGLRSEKLRVRRVEIYNEEKAWDKVSMPNKFFFCNLRDKKAAYLRELRKLYGVKNKYVFIQYPKPCYLTKQ